MQLFCIALLSGSLALLSMPPYGHWLFLPLSLFIGFFWVSRQAALKDWLFFGFVYASVWYLAFIFAFYNSNPLLALIVFCSCLLTYAFYFGVSCLYYRALPNPLKWLSFPAAYVFLVVVKSWLDIPSIQLSAVMISAHQYFTAPARFIGVDGLDVLLVSIVSFLTQIFSLNRKQALLPFALFLLIFTASNIFLPAQFGTKIQAAIVQPAISSSEDDASRWSLYDKYLLESRIDRLLLMANSNVNQGVVMLPEGGNGLFNKRIARRQEFLTSMSNSGQNSILLSGKDLTPEGHIYNGISLLEDGNFKGDAYKSNLVPYMENMYAGGEPTVFDVANTHIGISICYDSIFDDHLYSLLGQGAELIYVASDDSSFSGTLVEHWHAAQSIIKAIEIGRTIVFHSNYGPTYIYTPEGNMLYQKLKGIEPEIYYVELPIYTGETFASRYKDFVIYVFLLAVTVITLTVRKPTKITSFIYSGNKIFPMPIKTRYVFAYVTVLLIAGAYYQYILLKVYHDHDIDDYLSTTYARFNKTATVDGIAPVFAQSTPNSCGAAALAYLLTLMGERVYERDILILSPEIVALGMSFNDMANFVETRGYRGVGYNGVLDDLDKHLKTPAIAHLSNSHFVTVLHIDSNNVVFFDPAEGKTVHASIDAFNSLWTGNFLKIYTGNISS